MMSQTKVFLRRVSIYLSISLFLTPFLPVIHAPTRSTRTLWSTSLRTCFQMTSCGL
jgi:hypothetical protein